ncbi:MAG TPA: ribonuclease HI [Candidatus Paceibacterota bacterium]|nr:ribonuclease HI [Candidatus Paceibacterota bacterium]
MKEVTIFCDGSSIGNPGPGGWGASIETREGKEQSVVELGGFAKDTTNNRMELTAALKALSHIPARATVTIRTDSSYVINGITKWVKGWERNGWQTKEKRDVLNRDLWEKLKRANDEHDVTWEHVRGHAGHAGNERVDVIANGFARGERVRLFRGSAKEYREFLKGMPKARAVSSSSSRKGTAYAYVSRVDGVVMTHKTWAECERRVKGKHAKFKKAFSKEEADELVATWKRE